MKTLLVFLGIVAGAFAEKEAPYPPSGWKPDGPQLTYPPPTPSKEYGPATTPAPTEQPTQAPQEPPATYIPAEESSQPTNGYQRLQNQQFRQVAPLNQNGQFFIITPQGQLQHIPVFVPQNTERDAETVEPQSTNRVQPIGRLMQQLTSSHPSQQRKKTTNENRQKGFESSNLSSITPDGRLERVKESQRQETPAKVASKAPAQGQTQFVAFLPAVPLSRIQEAAVAPQTTHQNGQYHVIYPNGRLHRVQYMNTLGADNRLSANVQYQEVEPIRGPLYTFGAPLVRVI